MVAVAVILAAVVATFALGIGEETTSDVPQASFDIEQGTMMINATGDRYTELYVMSITHTGGDEINQDRLSVRVNGEQAWGVTPADDCNTSDPNCDKETALWDGSGTVSSGSSVTVVHGDHPKIDDGSKGYTIGGDPDWNSPDGYEDVSKNNLVPDGTDETDASNHIQLAAGDTVRVVWESERNGETAVLAEHEVTDA